VDPARKLATFKDLVALRDDVGAEIVDGAIVTPPPPWIVDPGARTLEALRPSD
jgi:hypothetical protein